MAYTLMSEPGVCQPVRLIVQENGQPVVKDWFQPYWWVCDPCNPSTSRYEVTVRRGQPDMHLSWYQVVLGEDTAESVQVKLDHFARVIEARAGIDAARREYQRLTGCGWSVAL